MKTYLPEFYNRLKRFFFVKDADQEISDDIRSIQATVSQPLYRVFGNPDVLEAPEVDSVGSGNQKVTIFQSNSRIDSHSNTIDTIGSKLGLAVAGFNYWFNGVDWSRRRTPDAVQASAGASALTIVAAAGADNFNRVHSIILSTNNAGLVVLSDGLPSVQLAANGSRQIDFPQGWKQDTANTAITATLAGATLAAGVTFNVELV